MSVVSGSTYCPACGQAVLFHVEIRSIQVDADSLWVQLYDPKPRHKCPRNKESRP